MALRAPDIKDEHGWQILDEEDNVVLHESSRDKARAAAKNGRPSWDPPVVPPGTQTVLPAKPETPEQLAGRLAHETDQRIRSKVEEMRGAWLDLAADLYVFHKEKMWEPLDYTNFTSYILDVDIGYEPRWAYQLVEMYEQFVVNRGVEPERLLGFGVSKVRAILGPVRREEVSIDEAFADAEVLSKRDLELKYTGRASPTPGQPDTSSKVHTDSEPSWARCPTCGTRYQVDPQTGERLAP